MARGVQLRREENHWVADLVPWWEEGVQVLNAQLEQSGGANCGCRIESPGTHTHKNDPSGATGA